MTQETNNLAADLLRRRECALESSKPAVLAEAAKVEQMAIAEEVKGCLIALRGRAMQC